MNDTPEPAASDSGLPPEVVRLLHRALPSMVHLELLLLLYRTTPSAWTAERAAAEIRASPELVSAALADLVTSRVAEPSARAGELRFSAADDAVVAAVHALRNEYDRRPVTLIKALYNRPPSAVRAFADAFRLRTEDR